MRPGETTQTIHPEAWGAKPVQDPRGGDYELAKRNSSAIKEMLSDIRGPATYLGKTKFTADVYLSGWYPVCEEIRVKQFTVNMVGKAPTYDASGLKWIGPTRAEDSMIHFSESDYSRLHRMGLRGQPADRQMLAAIRSSCQPGASPQRGIQVDTVIVNDPIGYHGLSAGSPFQSGLLSGGPGSINNNDDFFRIQTFHVSDCEAGIRVTNDQSAQWTIDDFRTTRVDYPYLSEDGGSFVGRNWYPDPTAIAMIKCTAPYNKELRFDLDGFSHEHMKSESLIDVTSSLSGSLKGWIVQASGTDVERDFYWLRMREHARCRFKFEGLDAKGSDMYGDKPVRHLMQLGLHQTSAVEYKVQFENCFGAENICLVQSPGYSARTLDLRMDELRRRIRTVPQEYMPLGKLI